MRIRLGRIPVPSHLVDRHLTSPSHRSSNGSGQIDTIRHISRRDVQFLSAALDNIILEHGNSLKDIARTLSGELRQLQHTAPSDEEVLARQTGDGVGVLTDDPRPTFAALPPVWRPDGLEHSTQELGRTANAMCALIEEIERETRSWMDMMEGVSGEGSETGDVLGEIATESQEARAKGVGLCAPSSLPRPLRQETASKPIERVGWINEEDVTIDSQERGSRTVWYESEEWPDAENENENEKA